MQAIEKLREELAKAVKDEFDMGSVIRWKSTGVTGVYLYAAIKSPAGWFTTATSHNSFVDQIMSYEELVDYLSKHEVSEVAVATEWEPVL